MDKKGQSSTSVVVVVLLLTVVMGGLIFVLPTIKKNQQPQMLNNQVVPQTQTNGTNGQTSQVTPTTTTTTTNTKTVGSPEDVVPTTAVGPGHFACSSLGTCKDYENPSAMGCSKTYADRQCLNECGNKANWCKEG